MKTKYTKDQIEEAIAHWESVLESMNEASMQHDVVNDRLKALFIGILHDNALDSGIYNEDGIYFKDKNSANDFIIRIADVKHVAGNGYSATVLGGVDGDEVDFGTMEIEVNRMPLVDMLADELIDDVYQYAKLAGDGRSQGMQNALDAHASYAASLNEAGADDILSRWNATHKQADASLPDDDEVAPKKVVSYAIGNDTHQLYKGDLIIGMYLKKDENYADYSIWRMSKINAPKFIAFKLKNLTSSIKNFLTNNAEKIEGDLRGRMTLDEFIDEMKRVVGPSVYERTPALFVAGMQENRYHYASNPRHRGKVTLTTLTTGHMFYDLDKVSMEDDKFDNYSGKTKAEVQGESEAEEEKEEMKHTKKQIEEAIAHWESVLEAMDAKDVKPLTSKEFIDLLKKAIDKETKWYSFRYADPSDEGNATLPLETLFNIKGEGKTLVLANMSGKHVGNINPFNDGLLFILKDFCKQNNGMKLSKLFSKYNDIGVAYGKTIFKIVKIDICTSTLKSGLEFVMYIAADNEEAKQKEEDWI